ncbi:MAG: hypothetical protein KBH06_03030 [Spirochaetes bacterium]|nr:hypothetical protein [Spirochaetota bacterium]
MNKKITNALAIIIMIGIVLYPGVFRADLDSFAEDSKKEQKENRSKGKYKKKDRDEFDYSYDRNKNRDDADDDSILGMILGSIFELIFDAMVEDNKRTSYAQYPYEAESFNFFIKSSLLNPSGNTKTEKNYEYNSSEGYLQIDEKNDMPPMGKKYHFILSMAYQRTTDKVNCFSAQFSGKICNLVGPEFETRYYNDGKDFLSYSMTGLNLPMFQYDFLSTDFYAGAAFFRGTLKMEGFSTGLTVKSVPIKPLTISGKFGFIIMNNITYKDFGFFAGATYCGYEIYYGFRSIQAKYAKLRGFETGVRYWF